MTLNLSTDTMPERIQQVAASADVARSGAPITFFILGQLEVRVADRALTLSGPAQKQLLAFLLLHANRPVPNDVIAEALWGVDPGSTVKRLQMAVTRLRRVLKPLTGDDEPVLRTVVGGYLLAVEPGAIDAEVFEQRLREGRRALDIGDAVRAARVLRAAEQLWRGDTLADMALTGFAQDEIRRLDELRLDALEARVDAELALDRHAELAGELEALVAAHPTRDRFAARLMLALYRGGRQVEALDVYQRIRAHLVDGLGLEPGPELQAIQTRILNHDPALLRVAATPLPLELEASAAVPLADRRREYGWLLRRWERARAGEATTVAITGPHGIGKTRLAAELAVAIHRTGVNVHYVAPDGPSGVVAEAVRTASPTLLVVDAIEQLPASVFKPLRAVPPDVPMLTILLVTDEKMLGEVPLAGVLGLGPLDERAVDEIARAHTPDGADEPPPTSWLFDASGGVPGQVHALARQWARGQTAGRVRAGRAELRSMEAKLAEDLADLQVEAAEPAAEHGPVVCPFKGLASFQVTDAPYFFGRERLVAEIVARLVGASLIGIVGPSGSGKSSVLRAGLLPTLEAGVLPGSDRFQRVLIRPGAHPLAELEAALERAPEGPVLLAVDQFEETFTLCEDEAERAAFVARIVRASEGGGVVALAIRADFYGRCADYRELSRLLAANHVLVGPMSKDELQRAVECPAERVGLTVEPKLVTTLVRDVSGRPGALPLLSTALLGLWQGLDGGRRLMYAAYAETGGVARAVERLGDDAYARLDAAQQAIAQRVLLRLAPIDAEGAVERRQLAFEQLGGEEVVPVLSRLADQRLVTIHAGSVELAHEALIREWPRMRRWLQESQDVRRIQRSLSAEAEKWVAHDRDEDALLRGALLAEVQQSIDPATLDVATEREFLLASVEQQRRRRAARRRRIQLVIGGLAAGIVAIGTVALVAIDQRNDAKRERNTALSRSLALQSAQAVNTDPELALRLALWADDITPTPQADSALRQAALQFRRLAVLDADPQSANVAVYNRDGSRIVSGGDGGTAGLFDARSGRRIAQTNPKLDGLVGADYAPDGRQIALGFAGGIVVTDEALRSGRTVFTPAEGLQIARVAYTHAGSLVAGLTNGTAVVFSLNGETEPVTLGSASPDASVTGVDTDRLGRVVVADSDGGVNVYNADGTRVAQPLKTDEHVQSDVDFSADDRYVLGAGDDGRARIWNSLTGELVTAVEAGGRKVVAVAFSRDGRRFATAGLDGVIKVWDTASALNQPPSGPGASQLFVFYGQLSRAKDVNFGAASDRVVSAGDDGRALVWDAGGLTTITGKATTVSVDFNHTGSRLVTGSKDGDVRVFDPRTGRQQAVLRGPEGFAWAHFSPVADDVVFGRLPDSTLQRWSVGAPRSQTVAEVGDAGAWINARFDRSGTRIAYSRDDQRSLAIKDLRSGKSTPLGGAPDLVYDAQFSDDGKLVAAATESGVLYVWRLEQPGRPYRKLRGHHSHINTVDFGPDGRIVTTGDDRTVRVWDIDGGRNVVLRGHSDELYSAVFTPDGRRVISTSADGTVRLWDATNGNQLVVVESSPLLVYEAAMLPNNTMATLDSRSVVRVFNCRVCGSNAQVRTLAQSLHPRHLTDDERRRFLADAA